MSITPEDPEAGTEPTGTEPTPATPEEPTEESTVDTAGATAAGDESRGESPDDPSGDSTVHDAADDGGQPTESAPTESIKDSTAEDAPTEPAEDATAVAIGAELPDLTSERALHSALESLLLVVDAPADEGTMATALEQPVDRVAEALRTLAILYTEDQRGIDLRRVGGGWRFYTRDRYAPFVEKMLLDGQRAKLTRAALETLAVIAYRQPVTRARVAAVRGVNVDGVIRTLLARGLIEETGTDSDTGGILYRTTELFLERLGLSSLEELPPIAPLLPEVDAIDDV